MSARGLIHGGPATTDVVRKFRKNIAHLYVFTSLLCVTKLMTMPKPTSTVSIEVPP